MAPLAAWASTQNALKVAIFRLKIEKIFWGMPPPQNPASFPLHKLNHNVVSTRLFCRLELSAYTQHYSKFSNKQRFLASKTL